MEKRAQPSGMDSLGSASLFSSVLFVTIASMIGVAVLFLPEVETFQMTLCGAGRVALLAVVMVLGMSGVLLSMLFDLSELTRGMLVVLCVTALLCSGFAALVAWFAVSGASSCWS